MSRLGRLEKVDLRSAWRNEAQDFTPWLAEEANIVLLGETLGMDLEVEAVEQNVGPFRADILCRDTTTGAFVLIENQLERTDHVHLGQLMTYAAGLDAVTIVWIAAVVADEHRAAMDWLNNITQNEVRFFALEVELWKIGESPAAPRFNIVSEPNDWSKSTVSARKAIVEGDLSETRQMQLEYWTEAEKRVGQLDYPINPVKPQPQMWVSHGIGRTGTWLSMAMNTREPWIRVELYLSGKLAKDRFGQLSAWREEIDTAIPDLDWQELPDKTDCRICLTKSGSDPKNRHDWPRQHDWLAQNLAVFHKTFKPYVARLSKGQQRPEARARS